ncbi:uncharacterized protein LOC132178163 [Corylus avellana]|uniref:uncharacterized protein LOC132178163 n=1 Tax=Corylus avellana TaxID=13451 RepID=UPI00286AFFA6|nr:uncharacterized protein LOC132178163 [Corylus avellana]
MHAAKVGNAGDVNVTWKQKSREELVPGCEAMSLMEQGPRKKKECVGEGKTVGLEKKGRKINSIGKSGGLALLWSEDVSVDIQTFSYRHINGVCQTKSMDAKWKFIGFYGHSETTKRYEAWELLKFLARLQPLPWICIGDFNEITTMSEKWGGGGRNSSQMRNFQQTLESCELFDLGIRGPKYTWSIGQSGNTLIKERLDRGFANHDWCNLFPEAEICVEASTNSNHTLLTLCLSGQQRPR